jgi:hypothetical protein
MSLGTVKKADFVLLYLQRGSQEVEKLGPG